MVINFSEDYLKIDGDIGLRFFYVAIKIMFKRFLHGGGFIMSCRYKPKLVYLNMNDKNEKKKHT